MKETKLFYTPLWQTNLAELSGEWPEQRQLLLEKIFALSQNDRGVLKTNFGGWQSDEHFYRHPECGWLINQVMTLGNSVVDNISREKSFDDGLLWANINRSGDFNAPHTHPEAILSGAVYLKIATEDQGQIQFFDARDGNPTGQWSCFMQISDRTELTEDLYSVTPREGDILFFPGWLRHWVTPNRTDEDRVSMSFNLRLG